MASPGELIDTVAALFMLPRNAVAYPYRRLREAHAVSKGGRGRSAPKVTAHDAANLILAVIAELPLKDCIEAWAAFSATRALIGLSTIEGALGPAQSGTWRFDAPNGSGLVIPPLTALPSDHTLTDALAALITAGADGTLATALSPSHADMKVEWESNLPSVEIAFSWRSADLTHQWEVSRTYPLKPFADLILSGVVGRVDLGRRSMLTTRKLFGVDVFIGLGTVLRGDHL